MNDRMFDNPVFVKGGNSLIQEIACLEDALEFLYEWPENRRGTIYEATLRACRRAFDSSYPLSAAREGFCGFAKSVNIHEEVTTTLPFSSLSTGVAIARSRRLRSAPAKPHWSVTLKPRRQEGFSWPSLGRKTF